MQGKEMQNQIRRCLVGSVHSRNSPEPEIHPNPKFTRTRNSPEPEIHCFFQFKFLNFHTNSQSEREIKLHHAKHISI
jgi:hypothetical protein